MRVGCDKQLVVALGLNQPVLTVMVVAVWQQRLPSLLPPLHPTAWKWLSKLEPASKEAHKKLITTVAAVVVNSIMTVVMMMMILEVASMISVDGTVVVVVMISIMMQP